MQLSDGFEIWDLGCGILTGDLGFGTLDDIFMNLVWDLLHGIFDLG